MTFEQSQEIRKEGFYTLVNIRTKKVIKASLSKDVLITEKNKNRSKKNLTIGEPFTRVTTTKSEIKYYNLVQKELAKKFNTDIIF